MSAVRHVVGVMTGTSMDAIDAAFVRIDGVGLQTRATLIHHVSRSLGDLALRLRAAAQQQPMTAGEFARLAWRFGELHTQVVLDLTSQSRAHSQMNSPLHLICVHGQTLFHQPPNSWQMMNAAPIASRFKCPIVFDLRQADLAASGQGAPITPIADWILFRDPQHRRAIVNLGGFCNMTILPREEQMESQRSEASTSSLAMEFDEIRAFDVCACNQILDEVARRALGVAFDADGHAAAAGETQQDATQELRELLAAQRRRSRSLGTGDEALAWVSRHVVDLKPNDLAASAISAVANCIGDDLRQSGVNEVILAGGGARNLALREAISRCAQMPIRLSDDVGVPVEAREATCFAVLGALCADGVPITLPHVTGCAAPAPIAGSWCNIHANRSQPLCND